MRIVYVEIEGSNQTLQEGVRAMVAQMNKPAKFVRTQKEGIVDDSPTRASLEAEPTLFDDCSDDVCGSDDEARAEPVVTNGPVRKRGTGPKKDRNAGLKPVADLDFCPPEKQGLTELCSSKSLGTDEEKVLVYAYYLTQVLEHDPIGPNHILACFKHVGVPVPRDLRGTIRNIANKKTWLSFTDIENIRVTLEGQNMVEYRMSNNGTVEPEAQGE